MSTRPLVARGFTADVYAWGPGRVLKLPHAGFPAASVEHEFRIARAVHAAGLPVPAAYDLVEHDGRPGIVFERVEGTLLFDHVRSRPWTLFWAVRLLADLQAEVLRRECPAELPAQRDRFAWKIDASTLSADEKRAAHRRLAELPDGSAICHGDFHPANVILSPRGPVVIDWDTATRGHPLGDVAGTAHLLRTADLPASAPRSMHVLLKCSRALLHRAYLSRSLRRHGGTRADVAAWEPVLAAAATARRIRTDRGVV